LFLRFGFGLGFGARRGGGLFPRDAAERIARADLLRRRLGHGRLRTCDRRIDRHGRQRLFLRFRAAHGRHCDQTAESDFLCRSALEDPVNAPQPRQDTQCVRPQYAATHNYAPAFSSAPIPKLPTRLQETLTRKYF